MIFNNRQYINTPFNFSSNKNIFNYYPGRDQKEVNIQISYDKFSTNEIDNLKKYKYGVDLKQQINNDRIRKMNDNYKKKILDYEEDLRIQREREILEKRQQEDNQRYRPQIDLPIRKIIELPKLDKNTFRKKRLILDMPPIQPKKEKNEENEMNDFKKKLLLLNDNSLKYIQEHENKINESNQKVLDKIRNLQKDFHYGITTLTNQVENLKEMNTNNLRLKNKLYEDVHKISEDLKQRKIRDEQNSQYIYDMLCQSKYYNKQLKDYIYKPKFCF